MIKDFNKYVILTSESPEAFLNYRYVTGDPTTKFMVATLSTIPADTLYVNGIDINLYNDSSVFISSTGDPSIAAFHLYTKSLDDFDYNIRITNNLSYDDVSVCNRPFIINETNSFETSNLQVDDETSYLLLRTSPKFAGNIKLVLDSSNNLFLDTIKVSDILNNKKYRRQQVSSNSIFSSDIKNIFSTLPLGELYKVGPDDTLNISIPKTDIYKQYNLDYSYGSKLFEDELYEDDYATFAPLWINSKLPDYFAIFRLDGVFNSETYESTVDLSNLANKYLQESTIIKSWGLKNQTILGKYLRSHLNELLTIRSPLFLSLSDPDQKDPDPNTWYGIAVDKGIITGRSETPYFFDQKTNFTDTNAFISEGYERLNLLCPNLINMEFLFSDNDVSLYSMQRYFGLYLSENELFNISYYAENKDSSIQILSLDGKDISTFFNSSIFDSSGYITSDYTNRIFTLNDLQNIKRISNVYEINGSDPNYLSQWVSQPGQQLFASKVVKKQLNKFITINLKNLLSQGEHLRIVDKTQFKIWEIYGIQSSLLNAGDAWTYASFFNESSSYPTIYRSVFSVNGSKGDQINAIKKAFDVFANYDGTPFKTTIYDKTNAKLSFELLDWANINDIWFQRITSQTIININVPSSDFNTSAKTDDITFYGMLEPSVNDFERVSYDSSYGPINFELYGDRMSLMVKFCDGDENNLYSFDASFGSLFNEFTMYMSANDSRYKLISKFDISTAITHSFNYVTDPYELEQKLLIKTLDEIYLVKGKWNAYKTLPLNVSLMGINPVKDIDFTIYDTSLDSQSDYWYAREDDGSTYYIDSSSAVVLNERNSFVITAGIGTITINNEVISFNASSSSFYFNTFDGSALISPTSTTVMITYNEIDGTHVFKSYNNTASEENILNYYADPSTKSTLKYGLTIPYIAKWVSLGSDCRSNPLRLILDVSMFADSSSNFIPYNNNYKNEISFPVYKYLSSGEKSWENYIYVDINDVISVDGVRTTIKNLMLNNPYIDVFSKIVFTNHNVNVIKNRSSILYYNQYKQSIDTIITGMNFSFFIDDNAKNVFNIKDWDRFKISFVSSPSRNRNNNYPIEVFVNENTKTIFMVWYQGADVLNYHKRYSSYFGGKNLLYEDVSTNKNIQGFKQNDKYWSYIKSPFIINNSSISTDISNMFYLQNNYDTSICSPINQLNWNFWDDLHSIFNAYAGNYVLSNSFVFLKSYDTFAKFVNYYYIKDAATFGNGVLNYTNSYMNNTNIYIDNTCNLALLDDLLSRNQVKYYIMREEELFTNDSFSVPPILITINDPKNYKGLYTYNGWYKPSFNNVLNFNYNENNELINVLNKDFVACNTSLDSYNDISQLWYNKVVSSLTSLDVSTKNAVSYVEDFNVFKTLWDNNYYIVDSSTISGVNSSLELPSFFGSKLIKLPYELILNEWDNITTKSTVINKSYYTLTFNITRKILSMFKNNEIFINNWAGLTTSDNIINEYIKKTILGYYNISYTKIKAYVYNKPYSGNRIQYTYDSTLTAISNIDSKLEYVNDEYIYSVNVPSIPDLSWFIKISLFEI
jgi:hypothetical protein